MEINQKQLKNPKNRDLEAEKCSDRPEKKNWPLQKFRKKKKNFFDPNRRKNGFLWILSQKIFLNFFDFWLKFFFSGSLNDQFPKSKKSRFLDIFEKVFGRQIDENCVNFFENRENGKSGSKTRF